MRRTFYLALFTLALALSWYLPKLMLPKPCEEPINYYIGKFDHRFNIEEKDLIQALSEAEAIWEKASQRDLFNFSRSEADLPINLIYDYRQETTEELSEIEKDLEDTESSYRLLENKYRFLKTEYESLLSTYQSEVRIFEERNDKYEAQVAEWNRGPRNSQSEFNSLERERKELDALAGQLQSKETSLNQKARELNVLVDRMNRLAKTLNLNVEEYNEIGAARGETYEGGVYYERGRDRGINIYEFSSRDKLVRLLAHELGHALGLDHVDDPQSIMYKLNQSEKDTPTQSDIEALEKLCENANNE